MIREYCVRQGGEFMNRPCHIAFLLGLLLLAASSTAQQAPQIDIDYASFAYDEQESLVELYMAVEAGSLTYETSDSLYTSTIPLELSLLSSSDTVLDASAERVVWEKQLDLQFAVMDPSVITEGQVFLRQVRLTVVPGEYELQIVMPLSGQDPVQASRDVIIPDYGQQENCAISDIILASRIMPSEDREDPFYKNGLRIRPNANLLFGEGAANLFYYAEAYNTVCTASDTGEYTAQVYVSEEGRSSSVPIAGLQKRSKREVRQTDVLVGSFNLSALVSGVYFLHMEILDEANESKFGQIRKFFVSSPAMDSVRAHSESLPVNNYAAIAEDNAEQGLIRIRYVEDITTFEIPDEPPQLIGDPLALLREVSYSARARRAYVEGLVIVQFTVDEEGNPRDAVILRGIGGGLDEDVMRVITEHGKFRPAVSQGNAVSARVAFSMLFKLR